MAQGRKKNARRRGVSQRERQVAQVERQTAKAERKERIQHILVVAFAIIMALSMVIPSLASIFATNSGNAQTITDSEGNVYEIGKDGSITLVSSPTVEDIDTEFTATTSELEKKLESNAEDLETLKSLGENYTTWAYRVQRKAETDEQSTHATELFGKAREYFDKYLAIEDSNEVATSRAMTYYYTNELDTAIEGLNAILEKGDYSVAWANLGMLYETQGDTEKATEAYQKAMETDPDDAEGAHSYAESRLEAMTSSETESESGTTTINDETLGESLRDQTGVGF